MTPLPRTVPRLTAQMICKGRPFWKDKCCLNTWLARIFTGHWYGHVLYALGFTSMVDLVRYNDGFDRVNPTEGSLADLWNRVIPTINFDGQRYELDPAGNQFVLKDGGK